MRRADWANRVAGLLAVAVVVLVFAACSGGPEKDRIVVYAAASLTDALGEVADSFEAERPGLDVLLNVAASSLLARQIEEGAPADVFFSADTSWMRQVARAGRVLPPVRYPLGNSLVLAVPASAPVDAVAVLRVAERLALADPTHVPAGRYAEATLRCLGLWSLVAPRVIPVLDVRAALRAVTHRAADAAVVYATDLRIAPEGVKALPLPASCMPEIRYAAAAIHDGAEEGAHFLDYALAPARRGLWERHGFRFLPETR